jgi:hypothetical protein
MKENVGGRRQGLLHRGLYTIFFTTRYVKTLPDNDNDLIIVYVNQ